jgi:oligosaccharide repeat unit polymerase
VLLLFLLLFHGPAYLYYTRVYGPETDFYETILSAARGQPVLPTLDLALALAFVCVCLGILAADRSTRTTPSKWRLAIARWEASGIRKDATSRANVVMASVAIAILLLVPFVFIDSQIGKVVEFFTASDLSEWEKIALRREGGGSTFYLYNLALGNVVPFVAFGLLALAMSGERRLKAWTAAFFVLVLTGKAATLSKAPLAVFLLQAVVVWLLMRRLTISWRMTATLGLLAGGLFLFMSWIANPSGDELLALLEFLFYRVFMVVNESLLEYFAAIPYVIDHSWGTQASWLAALFQTEPKLPTYWLVGEVHRGVIGSTTTVMFVGDAWADFAWAGVVVVSFLAGAVVRWIDVALIVRRGKTVATIAGLSLGHYGLFVAFSTSLQTALITGGLLFVVPLVALLSPLRRGRLRPSGPFVVPSSVPARP